MTDKPDGGRMFPDEWGVGGMQLRDYFAGQVVAAMVGDGIRGHHDRFFSGVAASAYMMADAMIVERNK